MKLNLVTFLVITVAAVVFGARYIDQPWPPLRIAGAIVMLLSLAFIFTARLQLGRSFAVRAKATRLVTTGLYRRLRNPIYIFGCLFFIGLAMFIPTWWPLALLLLIIPMQVVRARREAAVLEAEFGEEYKRYRAGTWM
jgi:protein-S-isoprenylcysteine O-methyltransferase Ste14